MAQPSLLLSGAERDQVQSFFDARVAAVDAGTASVREGLSFLNEQILPVAKTEDGPNGDLLRVMRTAATVARSDMSSAFSLWCQRMVMEYLWFGSQAAPQHAATLGRVNRVELLGSTGLAAAMAHCVSGAPLPIQWQPEGDEIVLNGRISWASNLFPPDFVLVTAAAHVDDEREIIVAIPGGTPGLNIDPYPDLLALQATGSSSIKVEGLRLPREAIVTEDFWAFAAHVRPRFLLIQSSFAWGLASRSLDEAHPGVKGVNEVLQPDLDELTERREQFERTLLEYGGSVKAGTTPLREIVALRLSCARLAMESVALEAKAVGGRGYTRMSATARRYREAAFLPVQAPTEGQLRWELQHSA